MSLYSEVRDYLRKSRDNGSLPPQRVSAGVYDKAVETVKHWFRIPHNRDNEGYASTGDIHRIISSASQDDVGTGSDIMRQMIADGLLELHEKRIGLIRLRSDN